MPTQADVDVAYAAESILLQYMFRKDLAPLPGDTFAKQLSQWPNYGTERTIANISLDGFWMGPVPKNIEKKCAYINSLIKDPSNGV